MNFASVEWLLIAAPADSGQRYCLRLWSRDYTGKTLHQFYQPHWIQESPPRYTRLIYCHMHSLQQLNVRLLELKDCNRLVVGGIWWECRSDRQWNEIKLAKIHQWKEASRNDWLQRQNVSLRTRHSLNCRKKKTTNDWSIDFNDRMSFRKTKGSLSHCQTLSRYWIINRCRHSPETTRGALYPIYVCASDFRFRISDPSTVFHFLSVFAWRAYMQFNDLTVEHTRMRHITVLLSKFQLVFIDFILSRTHWNS